MSSLGIKRFDFTDASDYTLTGDCAIAGDLLGLTDPATSLAWTETNWLYLPTLDGNGDAVLPQYTGPPSTQTWVLLGGEFEYANDASIEFWAKWASGRTGYFQVTMRDNDGPNVVGFKFAADGTLTVTGRGGVIMGTADALPYWPQDNTTWVRIVLSCVSTTAGVRIYSEAGAELMRFECGIPAASPVPGSIRFMQTDADTAKLRIGGGTQAAPIHNASRSGAGSLDADQAYYLPTLITQIVSIVPVYDHTNDPTMLNDANVTLTYNLYHGGAWSDWTAVPSGGVMTGVTVSPGDQIRVAAALSNAAAYDAPPALSAILLVYRIQIQEECPSERTVLNAIKTALDADATITALTGWDPSGCIICDADSIGQIPMQAQTVCYIARGDTTPEPQGTGKTATSVEATPAMIWYQVFVVPAVQYPTADPSDVLVGNDALEELTEAVWAALKTTNLSGAVKWLDLVSVSPVGLIATGDNLYVRANRIELRAMAGVEIL